VLTAFIHLYFAKHKGTTNFRNTLKRFISCVHMFQFRVTSNINNKHVTLTLHDFCATRECNFPTICRPKKSFEQNFYRSMKNIFHAQFTFSANLTIYVKRTRIPLPETASPPPPSVPLILKIATVISAERLRNSLSAKWPSRSNPEMDSTYLSQPRNPKDQTSFADLMKFNTYKAFLLCEVFNGFF
jgi:hypothetical protein